MSADENISISIDDAAIDNAIAKLNEALAKKEQLTGQPTQSNPGDVIINEAPTSGFNQPAVKLDKSQRQLSDFSRQADSAAKKADSVLSMSGEIKGVESSANRIIRMIPGLREANRLQRSIRQLSAGNIVGAVGLFMLAIRIYRIIDQYYKKLEQEKQDYQRQIMEISKFTTAAQFKDWETNQRQIIDNYIKNGVIL